ncbi:MAG: type I-B CRISPR-associated protein Cas5 [Armatimonadota bacterium]|jgi:CRISPR-associated protein Cas5t|nr:MAG: type I-B CRISPR-associated protein Cas5 [Armatimonadota bacterium]
MQVVHAVIRSETASFRVHYFMKPQPTLSVPPPSTIIGLLRNAAGRWVDTDEISFLAYRFEYAERGIDVEKIYKTKAIEKGTDIVSREFLYNTTLHLYIDPEFEYALKNPHGILTLGRSQDLATVELVETVELIDGEGEVSGVLVDSDEAKRLELFGAIYALPIDFTRTEPRHPTSIRSFTVIDCKQQPVQQARGLVHEGKVLFPVRFS